MTRLHPFDHVFAPLAASFAEVRAEADAARCDTADRTQFASLQTVRQLVARLEDPDTVEGDPEAADQYLTALWAGYRFRDAGEPTLNTAKETLARRLDQPGPPAVGDPLGVAYARLPERWVWAQVAPEAPHEPIDGLFVVPGAGGRDLTVVAVLGLRAERPGFGQITVHATPDEAVAAFSAMRTPPFAPVVDGGDAAGIRSVVTRGELLVLAMLAAAVGVPAGGQDVKGEG
jgi:hypothetical protein